jgi:hypothetical protein
MATIYTKEKIDEGCHATSKTALHEADAHEAQAAAGYHGAIDDWWYGLEKQESSGFEADAVRSEIILYGAYGSRRDRLRHVPRRPDEGGPCAR